MDLLPEHINSFLAKCRNANWAGVFYSSPFQKDFHFLLQALDEVQFNDVEEFIFHPFDPQQTPIVSLHPQYRNNEALQQLAKEVDVSGHWDLPLLSNIESTRIDEYHQQFETYAKSILKGDCTKAILSTVTKKEIPIGFNMGEYVFQLRKQYPGAFVYLFSSPITGTWIGATPETFLNWSGNQISTMSLAGTKNEANLTSVFGEKEKQEQQIVTNYIRDVFSNHFSEYRVEDPDEVLYGDMLHLLTRIVATTPEKFSREDFTRLSKHFHPTPAVGGFPKQAANNLILHTEKHPRLYYSGYLGHVTNKSAALAVNLRCMTFSNKDLFVFAGGGITRDSNLGAEWAETRLKAQALLKYL